MAAVEEWVTGHERLCAERYGGLKSDLRWLIRGVFAMFAGIIAWLAVQLWGTIPHVSTPPVTVVQSQAQPTHG